MSETNTQNKIELKIEEMANNEYGCISEYTEKKEVIAMLSELATFTLQTYKESFRESVENKKKNNTVGSSPSISSARCNECGKQEECTCDIYNEAIDDILQILNKEQE